MSFWHRTSLNSSSINYQSPFNSNLSSLHQGGIMKIKVNYDETKQTEYLNGNFVFVREGNKIRNVEAKW